MLNNLKVIFRRNFHAQIFTIIIRISPVGTCSLQTFLCAMCCVLGYVGHLYIEVCGMCVFVCCDNLMVCIFRLLEDDKMQDGPNFLIVFQHYIYHAIIWESIYIRRACVYHILQEIITCILSLLINLYSTGIFSKCIYFSKAQYSQYSH